MKRSLLFLLATTAAALLASGCYNEGPSSDADAGQSPSGTDYPWYDSTSNLTWQRYLPAAYMDWKTATSYCESFGGGWHLPTIGELRSLIRFCSNTDSQGPCSVSDSCLKYECWDKKWCAGNSWGHPILGCCWPEGLAGQCSWYWSSSAMEKSIMFAWTVDFSDGGLDMTDFKLKGDVRCVRVGQ